VELGDLAVTGMWEKQEVGDSEENRTLVITARKGPVSTLTRRSEKNA
jgi:hypothetical protein